MNVTRHLLAALAFAAIAAAPAIPVAAATNALTVTMNAQNGSGESGTATLTQVGADVQVVLTLKNGSATPQPAHIHVGACSNIGDVAFPLSNVVNGGSVTVVKGATIDNMLSEKHYSINVHQSADNLGKYVSCGNVTKPSSM
jgi:Cu/Zn superoxide dismutase